MMYGPLHDALFAVTLLVIFDRSATYLPFANLHYYELNNVIMMLNYSSLLLGNIS